MRAGDELVTVDINGFAAAVYYVVVGLGWVLPAMALVKWMAGPPSGAKTGRP